MNRSALFQIAAVATLAIVFSSQSPAEDPHPAPNPKDRKELFGVMLEMMGNPYVEVRERLAVEDMLIRIEDRKDLIDSLIEHLDDERVMDPSREVPSGNGAKSTYTVADICDGLLRYKFQIPPRSKYKIGGWKEWWKKQTESGKSFEDIWAEVKDAGHN